MTFKGFSEDDKTMDAVVRNLEIIGEAANRLSTEFKNDHRQIDWRQLRGLRNRIVHEYFGIDYEIIWQTIGNYLPTLLKSLHEIR